MCLKTTPLPLAGRDRWSIERTGQELSSTTSIFGQHIEVGPRSFTMEDTACARYLCGLWKCCRCVRTKCASAFHFHFENGQGNKIAGRYGAPRPPMTDVGTETAFRLDQRKHFRKSKHLLRSEVSWCDLHLRRSTWHCTIYLVSRSINMLSVTDFVRKGIISGVRVQAGLHLDMLDVDRSPIMQSAFLPELHRWTSNLNVRHLHACPPGDLLITMVKETVILYKKEFRKMKKSRISPWCERDENAKWLRDCLWLCQACKRGFTCRPMWRNLRQEAHSYPQANICSAPLSPS